MRQGQSNTPNNENIQFFNDQVFFLTEIEFQNSSYSAASAQTFVSLATKLAQTGSIADFVVPMGGTVEIQLFHNGIAVPGFSITYTGGQGGILVLPSPTPELIAANDDFALRIRTTGFFVSGGLFLASATIGTA